MTEQRHIPIDESRLAAAVRAAERRGALRTQMDLVLKVMDIYNLGGKRAEPGYQEPLPFIAQIGKTTAYTHVCRSGKFSLKTHRNKLGRPRAGKMPLLQRLTEIAQQASRHWKPTSPHWETLEEAQARLANTDRRNGCHQT